MDRGRGRSWVGGVAEVGVVVPEETQGLVVHVEDEGADEADRVVEDHLEADADECRPHSRLIHAVIAACISRELVP